MEANWLQSTVYRMINTRATTWEITGDYLRMLIYASDHLNLSAKDKITIDQMIQEYHLQQDHYKPTHWAVTAGRTRALYAVSKKLHQPTADDISSVIHELKHQRVFETARNTAAFLTAIGLLEYLYTNLDKLTYNNSRLPNEDTGQD